MLQFMTSYMKFIKKNINKLLNAQHGLEIIFKSS